MEKKSPQQCEEADKITKSSQNKLKKEEYNKIGEKNKEERKRQQKEIKSKMVYSIKNSETGEVDYIYADCTSVKKPKYDDETGEPLNGQQVKIRYRKHGNFHIPKMYLRATLCDEFENSLMDRYHHQNTQITVKSVNQNATKTVATPKRKQKYEREDYIKMEGVRSDIVLGYAKDNCRLFLIPTLFCYNMFVAMILATVEIGLHVWAHRKNKLNMNNKLLYFRSPMHVLTSQFCAICATETDSKYNKIFNMLHEEMARKSGALNNITKVIS